MDAIAFVMFLTWVFATAVLLLTFVRPFRTAFARGFLAPRKLPLRRARWTLGLAATLAFALFMVIVVNEAPPPPSPQSATSEATSVAMPNSEQTFIGIVEGFERAYDSAATSGANELQMSNLRAQRAAKIGSSMTSAEAQDWIGTLDELGTNGEGKAYVSIKLEGSDKIKVKTWNNAVSDIEGGTLIPMDTQMYSVLSRLSTGQTVAFSGSFLPSGQDGFRETSLTESGSMTDPDFLMLFSSIQLSQKP